MSSDAAARRCHYKSGLHPTNERLHIIKAAIAQVKLSRELNKIKNFESLAEDFEPIMDGFLETIMAAACKGVSTQGEPRGWSLLRE